MNSLLAASVNLILQGSEAGGLFEYHHDTRSNHDPWAFDRVKRILAGESTAVSSSGLRAGSLVVFSGRYDDSSAWSTARERVGPCLVHRFARRQSQQLSRADLRSPVLCVSWHSSMTFLTDSTVISL